MTEHELTQGLLGAYALNAVSASEHRRIAKHLETCAECAHEARLLGDVASELAWLPGPEESGDLVDEIVAALPSRPRRATVRIISAVAAVSVAAAAFLGVTLVRERSRNDDVAAALAAAHDTVALAPKAGFDGSGTLHVSRGGVVVIFDDLPDPGSGRGYQLWAISGGKPSSVGVMDGRGRLVRLLGWTGNADAFAVTIEPAGGSPVPTTDPVLASF